MKLRTSLRINHLLSACLLLFTFAHCSPPAEASHMDGVVDDFNKLIYFRMQITEPFTTSAGSTILFSSAGFDPNTIGDNQRLLPGDMARLDGVPNDDGSIAPTFIEIDNASGAVAIALAFDFPNGGLTGMMEGNPTVKFDYSTYSVPQQETLEMIAALGGILTHQGAGGGDIHLLLVPEPATWSLLALSIVALACRRRIYSTPEAGPTDR